MKLHLLRNEPTIITGTGKRGQASPAVMQTNQVVNSVSSNQPASLLLGLHTWEKRVL